MRVLVSSCFLLLLLGACGGKHAPTPGGYTLQDANLNLEAKFSSIHDVILKRSCLGCHGTGGNASGVPLNTLPDLLTSPRDLVLPENPDESGLWLAINRTDSRQMPPATSGQQPLSQEEKLIVYKWIQEGARP